MHPDRRRLLFTAGALTGGALLPRGLVSCAAVGVIGWTVALVPQAWPRLFAADPAVVAASVAYITRVAPFSAVKSVSAQSVLHCTS